MLIENLKNYNVILASGSPRRQEFFRGLGIDFEIKLKPIEENYPGHLERQEISDYLAKLKSEPFHKELKDKDILITSDTIVWHQNEALGKPENSEQAFEMIKSMSGQTHEVITSICFTKKDFQKTVHDVTEVTFKDFTDEEIWYYVQTYNPLDKAGAYGIQEWIGQIGVTKLVGSYFNVMGLPVHLVYQTLKELIK
ncbi:MAG: septum formation protein Maf [Flavobacteriaceae bacterium]|nr:septum formation protein Maf [Bacteroidia bacterium]NNL16435.1 septum formation protein Maf [Flavobacteriaceae bacterium]